METVHDRRTHSAAAAGYWLFGYARLAEFSLTGVDQAPFQSRAQLNTPPLQIDLEWTLACALVDIDRADGWRSHEHATTPTPARSS